MADTDPWTMLLRAPRARDAFLLRVVMGGPWSLLVADEAPLTVMGQLQGNAWFAVEGGEPTLLHPGDVVLCGHRCTTGWRPTRACSRP